MFYNVHIPTTVRKDPVLGYKFSKQSPRQEQGWLVGRQVGKEVRCLTEFKVAEEQKCQGWWKKTNKISLELQGQI